MKILKLRASFGKLHGELSLEDGMNVLSLPNEAGKSTWSAFLLAMLYGIDTAERAGKANDGLPAKERYKPWDGSAMEGSAELLWQGRRITIERKSSARIPMGSFSAYETESGIPIPDLTGENCGRVLCGVERSVFERTAFIRQLGLTVSEDAALEKRLGALVSTGEEGKSCSELERELRNLKNKYTLRSNGRVAKLYERRQELARRLDTIRAAQEEAMALSAEQEAMAKRKEQLDVLLQRAERAHAAHKRAGLEELEQKAAAQELLCRRLEAVPLPEEKMLHPLLRELDSAENALQTARIEAAFSAAEPSEPPAPACFTGVSAEAARQQAAADLEQYHALCEASAPRKLLPCLLCALLIAVGAGLCFLSLPVGLAVAALGAAALIAVWLVLSRKDAKLRKQHRQAELLLFKYGATEPNRMTELADEYAARLTAYHAEKDAYDRRKQALTEAIGAAEARCAALLEQVKQFAPRCTNAAEARQAISAALEAHARLSNEQRTRDSLRQQLQSMRLILGDAEQGQEDAEALQFDPKALRAQAEQAAQELSRLSARLAHKRGEISAQGDAVGLEAEREELDEQLRQAETVCGAIDLALEALHCADDTLRSRFSPRITAEAGRILAELTQEKYADVLLSPDMHLSVRESEGVVMRPAAAMSKGTADQMYLALRLAMCRLLLPPDAPLILDDALASFDDTRAAAALAVLRREAAVRQILLFTCHSRERSL